MDNGDLVTISHHAVEDIRNYSNTHAYRLQRLRHPLGLSARENTPVPFAFEITATFPNPFNSGMVVRFNLPYPGRVGLKFVDVTGMNSRDA